MRVSTLSMALSMVLLHLCGGSNEATPTPVGAAATGTITVSAQHGGVLVAADDAWIELVTKQNGEVEAYVVDAQGQPLGHEQAQVTAVQVQGSDGQPHDVQLTWDASASRYAGRTEIRPVAEAPAEVQVVLRGQPRRARAPRVVVVESPPPAAVVVTPPQGPRGTIVVRDPTPPPATVVVEGPRAPQATVVVEAPRPPQATVVVEAPRAPQATVVVQPPRPPQATVVVQGPQPPRAGVVVTAPPPPVVVAPPRPGVVVVAPQPRATVVVEDDHRGRGHAYGRRGREAEARGTVVVAPPRPGAVVVSPPHPGRVEVHGGGGGRVEVRGGGGHGRGRH